MRDYAAHVDYRAIPGTSYDPRELGVAHETTPQQVLDALRIPTSGRIYDLDSGRWPGMPVGSVEPPFVLNGYRSPGGVRAQGDIVMSRDGSPDRAFMNDLLVTGTHTGTHMDALSHITVGPDDAWFGDHTAREHRGDFGPLRAEASSILPFVCRGVLIDVAAARGESALEAGMLIGRPELEAIVDRQGVELRPGDAVLIRTGYMTVWGTPQAPAHAGAGIGRAAAAWLAESGAVLVGADTDAVEQAPATDPDRPLSPVHIDLLIERGIHLLELVYLEGLSRDRVYEFLFVCLPLRIRGATSGMARPIAVI